MERLSKLEFYSIDGKKITKEENPSEFEKALKKVIRKDINRLSNKLSNITKEIIKESAIAGYVIEDGLDDDIKNIDSLIIKVESIVSDLIVKKGSIKIGLFTSNKKGKKDEIKLLDEKINYISRCQNDIIAIKNEYNKLLKNKDLKCLNLEEKEVKNEEKEEDPLERTINFYMAKQG